MTKREREKEIAEIKRFLFWSVIFFLIGVLLCVHAQMTVGDVWLGKMIQLPYPWLLMGFLMGCVTGGWYVCGKMLIQKAEKSDVKASLFQAFPAYMFVLLGGLVVFFPQLIKKKRRLRTLKEENESGTWSL